MLDKYLIEHCSPTLASLKTANLFKCSFKCETEFKTQFMLWNEQLGQKGISLVVLSKNDKAALIYVYRRSALEKDLSNPDVCSFLKKYGYEATEVDYALGRLKERIGNSEEFPHEIGVFLGYPLGDVIGFVRNSGRNCKYSGCWKVYCNEYEAICTFKKYKKCREIYMRLWKSGRSVLRLTVAA